MSKIAVRVPEAAFEFATAAQIEFAAAKGIKGVKSDTPFAEAFVLIGGWIKKHPMSTEQIEQRRKENFAAIVRRYLSAAEARYGDAGSEEAPATSAQVRRIVGSCPGGLRPSIFGTLKAGAHRRQASAMILQIDRERCT